jgi:hypothetical protein
MTGQNLSAAFARLDQLEAKDAIRRVLSDYMAYCDHLDGNLEMDKVGECFTIDAIWEGRGSRYAAAFGRHAGRAAIVEMLDRYRGPVPHFAFNAHYLASETISVVGDTAQGRWMMLQASTYSTGTSDLRSAELSIGFRVEDGRWRIAAFRTTNLFSRPISRWDDPTPVPVPAANISGGLDD